MKNFKSNALLNILLFAVLFIVFDEAGAPYHANFFSHILTTLMFAGLTLFILNIVPIMVKDTISVFKEINEMEDEEYEDDVYVEEKKTGVILQFPNLMNTVDFEYGRKKVQ